MGIFKIQKELIELTSLQTHPSSSFSSGTLDVTNWLGESTLTEKHGFKMGVTGSKSLVARPSHSFKDFPQGIFARFETESRLGTTIITEPFMETDEFVGISPYEFATAIKHTFVLGEIPEAANITASMYQYVGMARGELNVGVHDDGYSFDDQPPPYPGLINQRRQPARNRKKKEIRLFRPPYRFDQLGTRAKVDTGNTWDGEAGTLVRGLSGSDRMLKDYIRKVLMPKNANRYTDSQFAYKNYHTLNFFTGSLTGSGETVTTSPNHQPDSACLIYNNTTGAIPPMSAPFGLDHPHLQSGWDKLPTDWSAQQLMYRAPTPETLPGLRAGRGPYTPTGSFTFEFYINPRYTNDHTSTVTDGMIETNPFHAGTVMHMPTVFAVSLVSGTSVDASGLVDGYRIMLQLSQSTEVSPRDVNLASIDAKTNVYPRDLTFLSDDNALKKNHWHYVGIRWGTERVNHGTGTFVIDGVDRGTFYVPSMSIAPQLPVVNKGQNVGTTPTYEDSRASIVHVERTSTAIAQGWASFTAEEQHQVPDPDILVIGNFYEGPGTGSLCAQSDKMYNFFNLTASMNEGTQPVRHRNRDSLLVEDVKQMLGGTVPGTDPSGFKFITQLNAEIHELKLYDKYRSLEDIITGSLLGPKTILEYSRSFSVSEDGGATVSSGRYVPKSRPEYTALLFYLPPFFVKESPNRSFLLNCVQSFKKDGDAAKGWGYASDGIVHGKTIGSGSALYGEVDQYGYSKAFGGYGTPGDEGNDDYAEYLYPEGLNKLNVYENIADESGTYCPLTDPPTTVALSLEPLELDSGVAAKYNFLYSYNEGSPLAFNSGTMLGRPFNAGLSFSTDATVINLENFSREFIGGIPAVPNSIHEAFNYQAGNYPRIMYMTASSVAQKRDQTFDRYKVNIGRVNSIRQEVNTRGITGSPYTSATEWMEDHGQQSKVDGKFLTHVSGALDHLYATGSIRKRNLSILPNDNGLFAPDFSWLLSGAMTTETTDTWIPEKPTTIEAMSVFVDDSGYLDLTLIGLQDLFDRRPAIMSAFGRSAPLSAVGGWERGLGADSTTSYLSGTRNYNNPVASRLGFNPSSWEDYKDHVTPDNPDGWAMNRELNIKVKPISPADKTPRAWDAGVIEPSYDFWIYQTTGDPSSNEIKLFDISNLYYGQTIEPGTFRLRDPFYTGSSGKVSITLRDDGQGGLYRADCLTKQAKWANVGNIFYNEGVGIIKSPHIAHFGKDYFSCDFAGMQNIHVMTVNAFSPGSQANSSSNPSYLPLSATLNANDNAPEFTYITSINLHDDNLNVIMRANLAQPVLKRWVEEFLFKIKLDF